MLREAKPPSPAGMAPTEGTLGRGWAPTPPKPSDDRCDSARAAEAGSTGLGFPTTLPEVAAGARERLGDAVSERCRLLGARGAAQGREGGTGIVSEQLGPGWLRGNAHFMRFSGISWCLREGMGSPGVSLPMSCTCLDTELEQRPLPAFQRGSVHGQIEAAAPMPLVARFYRGRCQSVCHLCSLLLTAARKVPFQE